MLSASQKRLKRTFDILLSFLLLLIFLIPALALCVTITIVNRDLGLFSQRRVGKDGRIFRLYKFKTLRGTFHKNIVDIKNHETALGGWLRKTKIDELPQVYNVLIGDMSFVGPRPDVPGYADKLEGDNRSILSVRPGITGPATIKYKNEDSLLLQQSDPNLYNDTVIWPDKVRINKAYVQNWSFQKDLYYLWKSVFN